MTPYRLPFTPEPCPVAVVEPIVDRLPGIYAFVGILVAMALAAILNGCDEPCADSVGAIDISGHITHSCYSSGQTLSIEVVNGTSFWHCSCLVKDGGR